MPETGQDRAASRSVRPSWGETKFFLIAAIILGGVMLGGVWTRIEEFETGEFNSGAIVMTIVVGLLLIALVAAIRAYLSRLVEDE